MGKAKAKLTPAEKAQRRSHTIKHLKQYSALYAMMILPLLYFIIFKYVPMFGNILAFRRYRPGQGMFGTEWTLRYAATLLHQPVQPDHHDQLFQISPARAGGSCSY